MSLMAYFPVQQGKVAAVAYVISLLTFFMMFWTEVEWWAITLAESIAYVFMLLLIDIKVIRIAFISHTLGLIFSLGAVVATSGYYFTYFGFYMMSMSFFHLSEYVTQAIFNPRTLSLSSFLIDHSREYGIAAVVSWVEFWLEYYFFPSMKTYRLICWIGLLLVVVGEVLRKVAMFTAGSNFTHQVQYYKRANHSLVTTGVYSYFRHPSYVGWFYWSIGTQLLLSNPICVVGYTITSWMFFNERIEDEEALLIQFFGEEYIQYQHQVGAGIPYITGYKVKAA